MFFKSNGRLQSSLSKRIALPVIVVVALLVAMVPVASAQDVTLPVFQCGQADYAEMTTLITAQLTTLAQPDVQPGQVMVQIRSLLDTYQAKCTGGTFTAATHPNGIIGPIVFDGTLYEITFALPERDMMFGSVEWTEVAGDCDLSKLVSISGTKGGSETDLVEFEGCTAIFEVNNNTTEWTLTITKVK